VSWGWTWQEEVAVNKAAEKRAGNKIFAWVSSKNTRHSAKLSFIKALSNAARISRLYCLCHVPQLCQSVFFCHVHGIHRDLLCVQLLLSVISDTLGKLFVYRVLLGGGVLAHRTRHTYYKKYILNIFQNV
jgi:hypothetical protein